MVDSSTVNTDAQDLVAKLSSYSQTASSLDGVWKGPSHDNMVQKAEDFVTEYDAIQEQMSSFASACEKYEQYKAAEKDYNVALQNYNNARSNNDVPSMNGYSNQMSRCGRIMQDIKKDIIQNLNSASSLKLEASPINATISVAGVASAVSGVANSSLINNLMGEVGNTISDYPNLGFHDGLWCADFVSQKLIENGCNIPRCSVAGDGTADYDIFYALRNNGSVVHLDSGAANMGYSDSPEYDPNYSPQPGDVVLFNWDNDGSTDHVGFVVKDNGDGTITTLEGNTSGDAGGSCVAVKTRDRNLVYGYATPILQA